ncbi:hypothetical protein H0E87_028684 [Populus deltoides]|uniref:Uncharacterized protein n=1 Tax=Populus deltoides TaxID=3696 RepID=A0A8T2WSS1_POPDE|nr:hypothetical protein H0E87_028684 [Populus deltoides]
MVWSAHVILLQEKEKPPQSPTSGIFYLNKHQTSTALAAFLAFPLKKKKRSLTCKEKLNDRADQFGDSAAKSKLQFASTSTMTRERLTDDRLPKAPKRGVQSR